MTDNESNQLENNLRLNSIIDLYNMLMNQMSRTSVEN